MENIDLNKELDINNKIILKVFNLIKMQDWKNLAKLIKSNKIDYNIKDPSGIYLLEYAILFNQIEIIKLLLDRDIRIDITDDNNKCILYNVIKFSYIDILKLILDKNSNYIGKSVLDIKDNDENTPLFYSIKFFNIEAIKLILNYTDNFYVKNIEGDNILHVAIKSKNVEIFKIIFSKNNLLKIRNNNGETCLHTIIKFKCHDMLNYVLSNNPDSIIQNLNKTEYRFNFSIIHYISIYIDLEFISLLKKHNLLKDIDGNIQDNSGNIFYHYFINNIKELNINSDEIKKILKFNDYSNEITYNINYYNIDGNTPTHILVESIDFFIKNKLNILVNSVLEKSNINIQNFNGESVLFLLVKNNYWESVKNILLHKKLDIFIKNSDDKTMFDYLKSNELDDFLKLVSNSYLNYLMANQDTKFFDYWDNRCKKNIKLEELNETEIELLKTVEVDNKNVCFSIIYNKLKNFTKDYIRNRNIYNVNSYPLTYKKIKLIGQYPNVNISTFTGSTLDVLTGLLYLLDKFNKNNYVFTDSSLKLMDISTSIINCNTIDLQSKNKICEISGFEILWKNEILYIPTNKSNDFMRLLNNCKNNFLSNDTRFLIIPVGIEKIIDSNIYSHANYLIFDFKNMEVERFEPHGSDHPSGLNYNPKLLDSNLEDKINSLINIKFKYFSPKSYLPKISFQTKEISELKSDYIGDPNGFCALWCIWWVDLRLSNPDIPRDKLVKILMKEFVNEKYSFKKIIRDYSYYIISLRDEFLNKSNSNINEWINDTISKNNISTLNNLLIENIKKFI
jgi:ankyrin repeat protein